MKKITLLFTLIIIWSYNANSQTVKKREVAKTSGAAAKSKKKGSVKKKKAQPKHPVVVNKIAVVFEPENDTVLIGKKLMFHTTKITGDGAKYEWQMKQPADADFKKITEKAFFEDFDKERFSLKRGLPAFNNCQFRCAVTTNGNIAYSQTITLTVLCSIGPTDKAIIDKTGNRSFAISTIGATDDFGECTFTWSVNKNDGNDFVILNPSRDNNYMLNGNRSALTITGADCDMNNYQYRCTITNNGSAITSNIDTLRISNCITEINNPSNVGSKVCFVVSANGAKKFKWQVKPANSGDLFIDVSDTDVYKNFNSDTLILKSTSPSMHGGLYRCIIDDKYISDCAMLFITGKIARYEKNRFQFLAAAYSGIQGMKDDNSTNLTQVYVRANIFRRTDGIDIDAPRQQRNIWFRNLFSQITYSTNVDNLKYVNITNANFSKQDTANLRGINRLDLLKNATLNINLSIPVLTQIIAAYKPSYGDIAHLYFQPFAAFLVTNVNNNNLKDTSAPLHIHSLQYGFDIGLRTEDLFISDSRLYFEMQVKIFGIKALSNSINPTLNFQESKILNDYTAQYSKNILSQSNPMFWNFDFLIVYNTGNTSLSNVFLHFSFFSNFVNYSISQAYNNYFQLQGGYAIDINDLLKKLSKKS